MITSSGFHIRSSCGEQKLKVLPPRASDPLLVQVFTSARSIPGRKTATDSLPWSRLMKRLYIRGQLFVLLLFKL